MGADLALGRMPRQVVKITRTQPSPCRVEETIHYQIGIKCGNAITAEITKHIRIARIAEIVRPIRAVKDRFLARIIANPMIAAVTSTKAAPLMTTVAGSFGNATSVKITKNTKAANIVMSVRWIRTADDRPLPRVIPNPRIGALMSTNAAPLMIEVIELAACSANMRPISPIEIRNQGYLLAA